jgi:transposase
MRFDRVGSDPIGAWPKRPITVQSARSDHVASLWRGLPHVTSHEIVESPRTVIVGVDTHKHMHVAVALIALGARLASCSASADRTGYLEFVTWACALGTVETFGIEGTGSYGVGLASFVRRHAIRVVEVSHCDQRKRRNNGKSDTIDAETAAGSVLSGIATAVPKTADGAAEMVRQVKIARDTAVKARSAAMITLRALIVNASDTLREALEPLTDKKLIDRCPVLMPGDILDPTASAKHALRAPASRWVALAAEIRTHDDVLDAITQTAALTLREAFGIGADSAAEMMILAGDNPTRVRSEAAFPKLCGACPIPASSRGHASASALSGRPPSGERGAVPHRDRPHALAPADHGLRRSTDRSGPDQEGHHRLLETLRHTGGLQFVDRRPPVPRGSHARRLTTGKAALLTHRGFNASSTCSR